jgi:lipopolysaccharide transport system permease protein
MHDAAPRTSQVVHRGRPVRETGFGLNRLARSLHSNAGLVVEMARRELGATHAGQMAGAVWLIAHPFVLFVVYAVLFTVVFKVRIGSAGPTDYLLYLFAGLVPWLLMQDSLVRSAQVIVGNAQIVKKVMFPLEVLVAKTIVSSLVAQSTLLGCVLLYALYERGLQASLLLLPLIGGLHVMLMLGLGLLVAILTPYVRDIPEFLRVFLTVNVYLMPVMYTPEMAPAALGYVLALNPFSHLVWCYQDVLYFGSVAHPVSWAVTAALALAALAFGSHVFTRLRHFVASAV